MKIYILSSSYSDNCSFIENYPRGTESIMSKAMAQHWLTFQHYKPITLELYRSDTGKKNYKFDFSDTLNPFLVFSEKAIKALSPVLLSRGQFLDVITDSKRKKYIGYYPTNCLSKGTLDLNKSIYESYEKGFMIDKIVLIKEKIYDDYLFTIEESISRVFVTDKFKKLVEENGLVGFEFSEYNEIELS
mgnify:CR=1 FL=1